MDSRLRRIETQFGALAEDRRFEVALTVAAKRYGIGRDELADDVRRAIAQGLHRLSLHDLRAAVAAQFGVDPADIAADYPAFLEAVEGLT